MRPLISGEWAAPFALSEISVYSKQVGCFLDGESFLSLLEDILLEATVCLLE